MKETGFKISLRQPFVMKENNIQKLWKLLADQYQSELTMAEIECHDNMKREFENYNALAEYNNNKNQKITQLTMTARSDDRRQYASLILQEGISSFEPTIMLFIEGDSSEVRMLKEDMMSEIESMKPWYAGAAKFFTELNTVIPIISLVALAIVILQWTVIDEVSGAKADTKTLIILWTMVACVIAAFIIDPLCRWIFPRSCFAIGSGETRHDNMEWIRRSIIVGIITTIIATLIKMVW